MHFLPQLLALPPCLLLLLLSNILQPVTGQALEWPYNLPRTLKYYPEDEPHIKRDVDIRQRLQQQAAIGLKKMSTDPGEKFFMDFWSFEDDDHAANIALWTNSTLIDGFEPSCPLHGYEEEAGRHLVPRLLRHPLGGGSIFDKRDFSCPAGTYACANIDRPNSCCATGSTCQIVQDTGLGDVGCCPDGESCGGTLGSCAVGYTSCPSNPGGGCCIPGYGCFDVGCVLTSTAVVVVTPTSTPISFFTTTVTSTVIIPFSPSISTSTVIVTPTTSTSSVYTSTHSPIQPVTSTVFKTVTISSTSTLHPSTCNSGFKSCAASTGGGCCPTGQACGENGLCPDLSSTASVAPPVRPTTDTTATTSIQSSQLAGCPTGFYACSAYYRGGCCQTGRNCDTTSCPATESTSLITTNGITIIAPTGSGISVKALVTGTCGTGWFSCDNTNGGGCCPNGFACGASCTATASGVQGSVVGKTAPSSAAAGRLMDHVAVRGEIVAGAVVFAAFAGVL